MQSGEWDRAGIFDEALFRNGDIVTGNRRGEVFDALIVRDGRVVLVGSLPDAEALADDDCTYIDLRGKCVIPAFFENTPPGAHEVEKRMIELAGLLETDRTLPLEEAVSRVTLGSADTLGVGLVSGSLEWGKPADFVVLSSSLADWRQHPGAVPEVEGVYHDGRLLPPYAEG